MRTTSVNTISRSINARRATMNAQIIDFGAYWVKSYRAEVNEVMDAVKQAQAQGVEGAKEYRYMLEQMYAKSKSMQLSDEEKTALKEMHEDGFKFVDISLEFLVENLTGTEWINEAGELLKKNSKKKIEAGEPNYVPVTKWTPMAFGRYLRYAHNAKIEKKNSAK